MRKLGIISDIHGNFEALEVVLEELKRRGVDKIYCLGDIVGYNPNPCECIEKIKTNNIVSIKGNHERAVLSITPIYHFNPVAREAIIWTMERLSKEDMEFLKNLPDKIINDFCFVHGSIRDPDHYIFSGSDAIKEFYALEEIGKKFLFFGHTHVQGAFVLKKDELLFTNSRFNLNDCSYAIINPGSVGQPRDGDWRAAAAILDDNGWVEFIRLAYPIDKVIEKIEKSGLPRWLGERLKKGI